MPTRRVALICSSHQPVIEQKNRTVSLLISGHIHDIEIQCEQQNVVYKGLGIFFSSKYKAVIQIGTLGCSHSLVSVVLIVERGWGGVGVGGQPPYSQCYFKFIYYKVVCCEICFLSEDRGQQWLKFMSVNEPLPAPQRNSARDNTGETILTSACDPTPARPACTRTQEQARQTG